MKTVKSDHPDQLDIFVLMFSLLRFLQASLFDSYSVFSLSLFRWCRNTWTVPQPSPRGSPPVSCTQCATPYRTLPPAHPRCLLASPCALLTCSPARLCSSSLLLRAAVLSPVIFSPHPRRRWDPENSRPRLRRRICSSVMLPTVPPDPRCPPATARPSQNCLQKHIKGSGKVLRFSRMPTLLKEETLKTAHETCDMYTE